MKKNNFINEHDMTKKMMQIIRGGYINIIQENEKKIEAVEIPSSSPIYKEELKKLKEIIYPMVNIKSLMVSKEGDSKNVNMKVVFIEGESGSGVDANNNDEEINQSTWVNKENRSGIYFELDLLKGYKEPLVKNVSNPKLTEILNKLEGYYDVWATEWAKQNIDDYLK